MVRGLFFIVLFTSFSTYAQNYSLFRPDITSYFTSQDCHLKGIRVDSVKNINNEIHYFLYRTPRGAWNYPLPLLDTNGGSWLGKEVIEYQDGVIHIPNLWSDTIIIHTQANLNDRWRFYDDTSQNYYEATITAYDTVTLLGSQDSLKVVSLSAYNASGVNVSDSIHGKKIILSKRNGVYQTFALYSFPFPQGQVDYYMDQTECTNGNDIQTFTRLTSSFPTTFDLYNFSVGDVFQQTLYPNFPPPISLSHDSIIAKNVISSSQVVYDVYYTSKSIMFPQPNSFVLRKDTVRLDTLTWFKHSLMPDEFGRGEFVLYNQADSSNCLKSIMISTSNDWLRGNMLNNFEPDIIKRDYKFGMGITYQYRWFGSGHTALYGILSFSRKNGIPCGSYSSPLSVNDFEKLSTSIVISPNPASSLLVVTTGLNNYQITIYNIMGGEVKHINGLSKSIDLPIADLSDGLYFLKIASKEINGFVIEKLLIRH